MVREIVSKMRIEWKEEDKKVIQMVDKSVTYSFNNKSKDIKEIP
jgi:hypothetical protein